VDSEQVADRLVECEQRLASLPELELGLEQALAENEALRAELDDARHRLVELTGSTSWRLTEPLRQFQSLIRRR
jgi:hypothetical protein